MPRELHPHIVRVAQFMAEHNITAINIDSDQSCPICLEEYDTRRRLTLQIKDAEGCGYIFCKTCLKKILRERPNEDKQCPLCRVVWIASTHSQTSRELSLLARIEALEAEVATLCECLSDLQAVIADLAEVVASARLSSQR